MEWNSFSEESNSKYILERSSDGLNWKYFSTSETNQNSDNACHYISPDINPLKGLSYYRLSKLNLDGIQTILSIQAIFIESTFIVYPNPAFGKTVNILLPSNMNNTIFIEWIDQCGKIVKRDEILKEKNHQNTVINIQELHSGRYTLRILNGSNSIMQEEVVLMK